jgi:hypothetical protein
MGIYEGGGLPRNNNIYNIKTYQKNDFNIVHRCGVAVAVVNVAISAVHRGGLAVTDSQELW